jgi:hypothetical protein
VLILELLRASSTTWIIDRLEGVQTQEQLILEYYRPPPEFERLEPADVAHLDRILAILVT